MIENPRIEALRRRVERDPKSIAFAQLAEEYRRAGDHKHAIEICREGLARHPGYLSAQVTLGRALIELGQFDEARGELEAVLISAPDNLAAIRALADIHQRHGDDVPHSYASAFRELDPPSLRGGEARAAAEPTALENEEPAPQVAEPAEHVVAAVPSVTADLQQTPAGDLPLPDFSDWSVDALDLPPVPAPPPSGQTDPALDTLEQWLAAIMADRSRPW